MSFQKVWCCTGGAVHTVVNLLEFRYGNRFRKSTLNVSWGGIWLPGVSYQMWIADHLCLILPVAVEDSLWQALCPDVLPLGQQETDSFLSMCALPLPLSILRGARKRLSLPGDRMTVGGIVLPNQFYPVTKKGRCSKERD